MKKIIFIFLILNLLTITGCTDNQKNLYLPEATNDKLYTTIGGDEKDNYQNKAGFHRGEGYTLTVPIDTYRYEKDYDDGILEEIWKHTTKDDVELKVTTYRNSDEITARGKFLKDNEEYMFEDFTGYSICGTKLDGDTLWFHLYEAEGTVYILSWEYPKNTKESVKNELLAIAKTFQLSE